MLDPGKLSNRMCRTGSRISSPNFRDGFGGSVVIGSSYVFGFHKGRVHTIGTVRFMSDEMLREDCRRLAGQESQISASEAYGLAFDYLQSASINVTRWEFGPGKLLLPIFEISLKDTTSTSYVEVVIDDSKEAAGNRLMSMAIMVAEAWQLSQRPLIMMTNALELNARPGPKTKSIERRKFALFSASDDSG